MKPHQNAEGPNAVSKGFFLEPRACKNIANGYYLVLIFFLAFNLLSGCSKDDKDLYINKALNKKWLTTSQLSSPTWIYPPTGHAYVELLDFAREYYPCFLDDYIVLYADGRTGKFNGMDRCGDGQPDKDPEGRYTFNQVTDSLIFYVPDMNGRYDTIRTRLLELTNDKMVIRYKQVLPFSNTLHSITQTYMALP